MSGNGRVWLAEKPSFGKDLARALGNPERIDSFATKTDRGIVVAAAGHLVELKEPQDYNEAWRAWAPENLPMVPDDWNFQYKPIAAKADRLRGIAPHLKKATEIVIATDAGREGEYIAWAILHFLGLENLKKKRLWTSGANVSAIAKSAKEDALLPYTAKADLAEAARIRAESDWVEGLNLTRLLTTRFKPAASDEPVSVGRVQTAVLAIIVRRHHEIEGHKPEKYFNLALEVRVGAKALQLHHRPKEEDRIKDALEARRILDAVRGQTIRLKVENQIKHDAPPKLFESSSLQIRAYNLWGWPASKTEKIAQALYDEHKLISYPRTDGIHLEDEQWHDVEQILRNIRTLTTAKAVQLSGDKRFADFPLHVPDYNSLTPRGSVFNSKALATSGADHHGIIPTTEPADLAELSEDERKLYLLIVRQFLAQMLPDCRYVQKSISWTHDGRRFSTSGRVIKIQGWRVLFDEADEAAEKTEADEEQEIEEEVFDLPDVDDGTTVRVDRSFAEEKFTIAPPQFTEGSIISAMRDLSKVVKDPAMREKLKVAKTIGTKSTWGETVRKLKDRMYISARRGKLTPTVLGIDLVALCSEHLPTLVDPTATAALEFMLTDVEKQKCPTNQARQILQSRNIDAIRRCLRIESAVLRAPPQAESRKKKAYSGPPPAFRDFEGGSHVLEVPFDDREAVKALGGKFNGQTKKWHLPKGTLSESELRAKGWMK